MLVHFLLQPPPSQERQEAGGPVLAEQEDSALGNTPKTPAGECSSLLPCAKTYIRAGGGGGVPRPGHGFTSGLFHRHGSGGRARHVTTLVATCCRGGKNYIDAYIALLKKLRQDCPCRQSCSSNSHFCSFVKLSFKAILKSPLSRNVNVYEAFNGIFNCFY